MEPAGGHHLIVVGGGFGGLSLVKALKAPGLRITLIDRRNYHLFQPLLYQVATTILPPSEIAWPLRALFARRKDVTTLLAEVVSVDTAGKRLRLDDGSELAWDTLVLATGAMHSYFGHDDWAGVAPGLKTLEDATAIRRRILGAFEMAERSGDAAEREALLTFAVIGAGPTGVEMAGTIAELAQRILPEEFRNIDTRSARVLLIEAGPRVLPAFAEGLSAYAEGALKRLGVTVMTGQAVTGLTGDGLRLGETEIAAKNVIWAAGVAASPAARWVGAEADRAGRAMVGPDLSVPGHRDVFVIGDTAHVVGPGGALVPGIAPAAKQQGKYVARVLKARLAGAPAPGAFRYRHAGSLATVGRAAAVVDFGRVRLKGVLAWWFWGVAHIFFLIGARSRVAVAWSWLWSYLTGQNSARLITRQDASRE